MNLATFLLAAYGTRVHRTSFGDGLSIRIDDQSQGDVHLGFCQIHLSAQRSDDTSVLLELSPAPHDAEVEEMVNRHGGHITHGSIGATIQLPLGPRDARRVRDLARAIRRVTRRGQRYPDPNWKWICPRTADSLERFAELLARARRQPANQSANAEPGPACSGRSSHEPKRG